MAQLGKRFRSSDGISSRVYKRRRREVICDESIFDNLRNKLGHFFFFLKKKGNIPLGKKNALTSSGRPHMVLYVTPKDASAVGRRCCVLRMSI